MKVSTTFIYVKIAPPTSADLRLKLLTPLNLTMVFITARTAPPSPPPPPPILVQFAELPMRLFVPLKCSELADAQIAPPQSKRSKAA